MVWGSLKYLKVKIRYRDEKVWMHIGDYSTYLADLIFLTLDLGSSIMKATHCANLLITTISNVTV